MPRLSQEEFDKQTRKVDELDKEVKRLSDMLLKVRGQPIVQGYTGKKLDLNENLNVVELFKYIDAWTLTVTSQVKYRFRGTVQKIYLEQTTDGGVTWLELDSFWP